MSKFKKEHQRFVDETVEIVTEVTEQFAESILNLHSKVYAVKGDVKALSEAVACKTKSQNSQITTILRELRAQRELNAALLAHLGLEVVDVEAVKAHTELKKVGKK